MKILALLLLAQTPPAPTPPSTDDLVKRIDATPGLKEQDKPFEIAASLGRLYFGQGRLTEAKAYYQQALGKAEGLRTFFLDQRRAAGTRALPPPASLGCVPSSENNLEVLLGKARAKAKAGDAASAASCAKAAWGPVADAEVQLGNLQFVLREPEAALATYEKALSTSEGNGEARYGRAAVLLDTRGDDPTALKAAKADFERFLKDSPTSPRAAQAKRLLDRATQALEKGGISKLPVVAAAPSVQPPQLSPEVVKAFEQAPRTPEMATSFEKLIETGEDHLAHGRFEEARASFLQVMPYQPTNPRLRAGMAWAMIRLNRQPMADNVWRAALENPDAVAALGDTLKAKGDLEGAREVWSRLKTSLPAYAPRLEGKAP